MPRVQRPGPERTVIMANRVVDMPAENHARANPHLQVLAKVEIPEVASSPRNRRLGQAGGRVVNPNLVWARDWKRRLPAEAPESEATWEIEGISIYGHVHTPDYLKPCGVFETWIGSGNQVMIATNNSELGSYCAQKREHLLQLAGMRSVGVEVEQISGQTYKRIPVTDANQPFEPF